MRTPHGNGRPGQARTRRDRIVGLREEAKTKQTTVQPPAGWAGR